MVDNVTVLCGMVAFILGLMLCHAGRETTNNPPKGVSPLGVVFNGIFAGQIVLILGGAVAIVGFFISLCGIAVNSGF